MFVICQSVNLSICDLRGLWTAHAVKNLNVNSYEAQGLNFCFLIIYLMKLRACRIRLGLLPKKVSFSAWGVVPPPLIILRNNPSFSVPKITLYDIFFEFGLQIPSCYAQGHLWTKLAPDSPLLRVSILNWGQLDKMQQLLCVKILDTKVFGFRARVGFLES